MRQIIVQNETKKHIKQMATTNSNKKPELTRQINQTQWLCDRWVITVRPKEVDSNMIHNLDSLALFSNFIWSRMMKIFQIVEKQVLSTQFNRNEVCTTMHTKQTTTMSDHKPEKIDSDKTNSLNSLISFFQRHYFVKNIRIFINNGKTSAINKIQEKQNTHDNNSKPGGSSSLAFLLL